MVTNDIIEKCKSWDSVWDCLSEISLGSSAGKKLCGNHFESIAKLYLTSCPEFSGTLQKVWMHDEIPDTIVKKLSLQRPEIGVDILAQVGCNKYWAIQCKFHSDVSKNVSLSELSTFFSTTEGSLTKGLIVNRLVVTNAYGLSKNIYKLHPEGLVVISYNKFGELDYGLFKRVLKKQSQTIIRCTKRLPRKHQKEAVSKIVNYYNVLGNKRGMIFHPCGTGKSLTSYWASTSLKAKLTVVAVPSLFLLRQTIKEWVRETIANKFKIKWIAVCGSSQSVTDDQTISNTADLGFQSTNSVDSIVQFLDARLVTPKLLVTTYQSSNKLIKALELKKCSPCLIIYDEAHRTVGSIKKKFNKLIYHKTTSSSRHLFMTATAKYVKHASGRFLSMNQVENYGLCIDQLSFKRCIEDSVLSDYKVLTIIFDSEDEKANAKSYENRIKLIKKVFKRENVSKLVSFHTTVANARTFAENLSESSSKRIASFVVSGSQSVRVRNSLIKEFLAAKKSMISNSRCLIEGVDMPEIDAIYFVDPKRSKVDIVQAAGRALRTHPSKNLSYIVLPVAINSDGSLDKNHYFRNLVDTLSALGTQDERIIEEISQCIADSKIRKRSNVFKFVNDSSSNLKNDEVGDLIRKVYIAVADRIRFGWYSNYNLLREYYDKHGSSRVQRDYKVHGIDLRLWASRQRQHFRTGQLFPDQITALEKIADWSWEPVNDRWDQYYAALLDCSRDKNVNLISPHEITKDGLKLGSWVNGQKKSFRKKQMPADRIKLLQQVKDWTWANKNDLHFNKLLHEMRQYSEAFGDTMVERNYVTPNGFRLGLKIGDLRKRYHKENISKEWREALESIPGWVWSVLEHEFELMCVELEKAITKLGHCFLPHHYLVKGGNDLSKWVYRQREAFRLGTINDQRKLRLEAIPGFYWTKHQKGMAYLRKFVDEYGHSCPTTDHVTHDGYKLGTFVLSRRSGFKDKRLSKEEVNELEMMPGWLWANPQNRRKEVIEPLKAYIKQHGHSRIKKEYIDKNGFPLGQRIKRIRYDFRKNLCPVEIIRELESIKGFEWSNIRS